MSDNPELRHGQDRERISLSQDHEVRYWTQKLGVSRDELVAAVKEVGPGAEAVRRRLQDGRH